MSATIFFAPDLHKRDVDFNSISGYRDAIVAVQQDIVEYLRTLDDGVFISLGDWYDRGYRSTGRIYTDTYYDREIAHAVNGRAYLLLGNHFFLERDANPEMYIIQPSYLYKPKDPVPMEESVFKTVPYLIIGGVQISFFHFDKHDKTYIQKVQDGVKYHIGLYHDDCVMPSDIRNMAGYFGTTSNDYLNSIFLNVDAAICGHIHVDVGTRLFTLNSGKEIPLIVPGALCITENRDVVKHKSVQCPVLKIHDDDSVEFFYKEISTHMDMLKFYKTREHKISKTTESLGTSSGELQTVNAVSLSDYLYRKNYEQKDVEFIMNMKPGTTSVVSLMQYFYKEDENVTT